jgi:dTDP-4-amino-4,6-dideoxygalactose transaminase
VLIPFNKPFIVGNELAYIRDAVKRGHLSGNGEYTKKCQAWLTGHIGCNKALLTHSGTAALEMAAVLADIQPGDEVIMPSYTFVSTANAFVLRGGVPVFVDIRPDTLNIDETRIEAAVTGRTKAIVPVHYAGVSCEMDAIMEIAKNHKLLVIEDAAQGLMSRYKGRPLGSIGHMAAVSFHETKNIISGEGGALLMNDGRFTDRAEVIWEKGTNRNKFFRGEVDKYTWVDIGSSFYPSEIIAAFLWAQLEQSESIIGRRLKIWNKYHRAFKSHEKKGLIRRPIIPDEYVHNGHMYYLLLKDIEQRSAFIKSMKKADIHPVFHYIPLDSSPAGTKYGRKYGNMDVTHDISDRLVRMPLWLELEDDLERIIEQTEKILSEYE